MSDPSVQLSKFANIIAIAAVIGAPYIAVRRRWDGDDCGPKNTSVKADKNQKKASNDRKQGSQARGRSIADILQGDSSELTKLRDAV